MNPSTEKKIDELLSKMTLHEKVGQLVQYRNNPNEKDELREMITRGEFGSFLCATGGFGEDEDRMEKNREYVNDLQRAAVEESRLGIPLIFGKDVIHGHNTIYPIPIAMAASFDAELVRECYSLTAGEAANDGIMWSFAPMIDLARDPRWGRCVEGTGEDPYLGAVMADAMVRGFQGDDPDDMSDRGKIAACAKHYIGYGAAEGGRDYHKAEISDYTLRNYYLRSFKGAVRAGVRTVMSSFNEISGQPVTSSHYLLTELLKDELGFDGYVVSDDCSVVQLKRQGVAASDEECAELALNAGLDMDMDSMLYHRHLEDLVKVGKVKEESIDDAVRRVLRVKFALGLFDDPYAKKVPVDHERNIAASRRMAGESIVLLKNEGNLLPLDKGTSFVVTGNMLDERRTLLGVWLADYVLSWTKTIREGIAEVSPETKLWCRDTSHTLLKNNVIKHNDVILVLLGDDILLEGEAGSVAALELPPEQVAEIENARRLGKKVIGAFFYGRPIALANVEYLFDAIIWAWHGGTEAGTAFADVLFGDVNPSGKLPMTLPRVTGQIPIYYNAPSCCRPCDEYYGRESAFENYRDEYGTPMYPFGYGLSYTTFEYSKPEVKCGKLSYDAVAGGEAFEVTVRVRNTGTRAGMETVQCYVRDPYASMTRPIKELCGFEKITLAPGEEKAVTFRLGFDALAFYHADKTFAPEVGTFIVYTGSDSYSSDSVEIELI